MGGCSRWLQQVDRLLAAAGRWGRAIAGYGLWRRGGGRCRRARRWARCSFDGDDGGGRGRRLRLRGLVGGGGMALNGEEGRRRVNNERVERCAAASETSLEMYVRVGVTEWKVETRRRAHEVGGRGSEHEEGPRHRFRVLLLVLAKLLSFVEFLEEGGNGVISVTANVKPLEMHRICSLINNKSISEAKQLNAKLALLHKAMFIESNPIPVKWILAYKGIIKPFMRLPMVGLHKDHESFVIKALVAADA